MSFFFLGKKEGDVFGLSCVDLDMCIRESLDIGLEIDGVYWKEGGIIFVLF